MNLKLIGVSRGNRFSPNRIDHDTAIFERVAELLRQKGCDVILYDESVFLQRVIGKRSLFAMAREIRSIRKLQKLELQGYTVINSGFGIENCIRENMTRLFFLNEIPHPKSKILPTSETSIDLSDIGERCWIKRGDSHTIHPDDVAFARNPQEANDILRSYARRNIASAVINEHLEGDLIKFYGIVGSDFFYWNYPHLLHHSKFGLEAINGQHRGIPFDSEALQTLCIRAAIALNLSIYGGDAVVRPDGTLSIIDLNDWPSFAPCLEKAAPIIARHIYIQL
jgi:hypothetical protein